MKNTMKAIAALIISATMISITACGNTDNTLSAAPKATTTAASETTEMGTVTSRSATTTSITATSNTSSNNFPFGYHNGNVCKHKKHKQF